MVPMMNVKGILPHCICLAMLLSACPTCAIENREAIKHVLSKFKSTWVFSYGMKEFLLENLKAQTARIKFILIWHKSPSLRLLEKGQKVFKMRECRVDNCFITDDHNLFRSIRHFDVLLFHAPETFSPLPLPFHYMRASHQQYVFVSSQASDNHPLCENRFENYFNMTWTYKLNSDLYFGYIIVKNQIGEIIGPKQKMDWKSIKSMEPVREDMKVKLGKKNRAAAWYISDCGGTRMEFAKKVEEEMRKNSLILDIYGDCATKNDFKISLDECMVKIEKDYYFYFAFEKYFSDDFVSGILLRPLKHYAVPVVYGAADYSRFMPDGIYLDAFKLGPIRLVQTMISLIIDKNKYYDYFKWHNHYSYHKLDESPRSDYYCQFCAKINNENEVINKPAVKEFRKWWMENQFRKNACAVPISRLARIDGLD